MRQTAGIICILLALTVGTIASSPCPDGFVQLGEKCYYFGLYGANWTSSESSCQFLGGHLASPLTAQENQLLVNYVYNNYGSYNTLWWLGGSDAAQEGTWIWSATNTSIDYSYWYPGQPANFTRENCLQLVGQWNYNWDDEYCDSSAFYICEHSIVIPIICPYGWVSLGEHCYFFHTGPDTWIGAESTCQAAGAQLADPVTSQENQLILNYIKDNFPLREQKDWWTAGSDWAEKGSWVWTSTNETIDYSYWAGGQPDGSGECMLYSSEYNYQWDDTICNHAWSFICQLQ